MNKARELGHLGIVLTVSIPLDYEHRASPIFSRLDGKRFRVLRITQQGNFYGHVKGEPNMQALRPSWLLGSPTDREMLGLPQLEDGLL